MFSRKLSIAILSVLLLASIPACAEKYPSQSWMGIYFGRSKIGYANFKTDRAQYEGQPCYRLDSTINTRLLVLDMDVAQQIGTTVYVDDKYSPVFEKFTMSSAGHTTSVTAKFAADTIVAELDAEGAKTKRTIQIPSGSDLIGDTLFPSNKLKLKVGDKLKNRMFNPLTLTLDEVSTEVIREEQIDSDGTDYNTMVVKSATSMGDITCWQDAKGQVLKAIGPMGFTMIKESQDIATSLTTPEGTGEYVPPSDLAVTAAASVSADIADPRAVKYLKIRFSGLADKSLAISDPRQKTTLTGKGPYTAEYEISAVNFDASKSLTLPIDASTNAEFLGESAYVQSANPEISDLAHKIVGEEKNAFKAVSLLRAWVDGNMHPKGDVGIVRSSVDVLHTKTGVCRDYAILYTSLARAAGIPTKVVSGLVYWKGKFYYHAWAESYVGEWIPIDATLQTDFVDATHVKFAEGDATTMFTIAKLMGAIKAEILKFE